MIASLALFAVVGVALIAFGRSLGPRAFWVGALPAGFATGWVLAQVGGVVDGDVLTERLQWVSKLDLAVDLRLDGLGATMSLIVAAVGVLVLAYAAHYFGPSTADCGRLAGLLVLFGGSMLGLVQADHVLVLYTCWELTSITSYLLIGHTYHDARARAAALQALLITGAGGLAMLGGLVVLAHRAGTWRLSEIVADPPPEGAAVTGALVLVLLGALTKSAQYPFHSWLPGAMAAPTPVSAYLHSATMVKAGVFLVARMAPAFAAMAVWRPLVLGVGCATLVFAGLRALRQHDLKLLLAYGTVSQLGLLVVLFGAGTSVTTVAGFVLLVAHALFKATLFMVVGVIDHETGTRDIREVPPLRQGWGTTRIATLLALASMGGVPLGGAFVAKELAYDGFAAGPFTASGVVLAAVIGGSMLTVAYAVRFWRGSFGRRQVPANEPSTSTPAPAARPAAGLVAPALVLAAIGLVFGVAPGVVDRLATASIDVYPDVTPVHLVLWHGANLPFLLSVVTLTGGALLVLLDGRLQRLLARGAVVPSGAESFLASLRTLGAVSTRVTAVVQSGSLPIYTGVILATAAAVAAVALLQGGDWGGWPRWGPWRELPIATLLVTAGLGAAVVRRRFAAALFLGMAGYAMAALFAISGAPDLALTQVAVETLTTVVFVLVLRRLPERFERQSSARRRIIRFGIATGVGVTVFAFALVAAGHRIGSPVSGEMLDRAVPDGHGNNVVNVILVDFRGFDTMGELTVLAVASIGAVALARVGRRSAALRGEPVPHEEEPVDRVVFVDVAVRLMFHVVMLTSVWLLFTGHNRPGGGFVGGLLAGSAITLRYVAGGVEEVRSHSRFKPWTVLGVGLLVAASSALVPVLLGNAALEVGFAELDLPLLGAVALSSALVFDTGVYLAVVGMVLMAYEAFGDVPVREAS